MSVNVARMEYLDAVGDWQKTRAALGGRRSVLSNISAFLPMTETMQKDRQAYRLFTERAVWYGASARTLDAWTGTITRKPMTVVVPKRLEPRLANINMSGMDINGLARKVVREICAVGRIGLLVDVSDFDPNPETRNLPYMSVYHAESIKSWRVRPTATGVQLDQVILYEEAEEPHDSGFGIQKVAQYRVLELDDNGLYVVRVYRMNDSEPYVHESFVPTRFGGDRIPFIPFIIAGPSSVSADIERAPLQDIVDVNASHFATTADHESALYWSASPTAVITGLTTGEDADEPVFQVGGGVVWKLPAGATASFLEFQGHGLNALRQALLDKQSLMATLGASLLNAPKKDAESYETVQLRNHSETSSLTTIADTVSKTLTIALRMACYWQRWEKEEIHAELNKDFVNIRLGADELKTLMLMVQSGLLSLDDYFYNLQTGEILRPGVSVEQAKDDALNSAPVLVGYDAKIVSAPTKTERKRRSTSRKTKTDDTNSEE